MANTNGKYDVVIIGGGVMGSSVAYHLSKLDSTVRVVVIEKDPTYEKASSTLSMANIRVQFSLEANVRVSLYAQKIFESFEDEMAVDDEKPAISFHQEGNLFLVDSQIEESAKKALIMQQGLKGDVSWWDTKKIKEQYPLYKTNGYTGGTFGAKDGHLDAYAVLMAYKAKAKKQGTHFLKDQVTEILLEQNKLQGVCLASGEKITAKVVINCAGAWARDLCKTAGIKLPVLPVKRQVFALDTTVKPEGPLPLTILPSGLYFRTETGGLILLGKSMDEDPIGYDLSWDRTRFMEQLWPELAEFVPAFDTAKLIRGWAGLYAVNTLDGNAILGEWPLLKGFYLANGFSGHGLQQAPAVGLYLAQLILKKPLTLDLGIFDPKRVLENKPLSENGLV